VPGDLPFLNSRRAVKHSFSVTKPSQDNFSSPDKVVMVLASKKVDVAWLQVPDF